MASIQDLIGKEFFFVKQEGNSIVFLGKDFKCYIFHHEQDCCESVYIESIVGDLSDLENSPLLMARESTKNDEENSECGQWTFYNFATIHGYVDIRWYGSSNGYYSVAVNFESRDMTQEERKFCQWSILKEQLQENLPIKDIKSVKTKI